MTRATDLSLRYAAELQGYGASLPDDFLAAATALEPRLPGADLDAWAQSGMALAGSFQIAATARPGQKIAELQQAIIASQGEDCTALSLARSKARGFSGPSHSTQPVGGWR